MLVYQRVPWWFLATHIFVLKPAARYWGLVRFGRRTSFEATQRMVFWCQEVKYITQNGKLNGNHDPNLMVPLFSDQPFCKRNSIELSYVFFTQSTAWVLASSDLLTPQHQGNLSKESINGNFRILKWRYLPYIRPSLCKWISPENMALYGTVPLF